MCTFWKPLPSSFLHSSDFGCKWIYQNTRWARVQNHPFWSWSMQNRAEKMSWMKMGIRVRRRIHTHFFTEITACTCKSCLLKMPLHTHLHNGPPPHIKIIFCVVLQACNILQLPTWTIFKFAKHVFIYDDTFCHKSDHELGDLGYQIA